MRAPQEILNSIQEVRHGGGYVTLEEYGPSISHTSNEFLAFLKPELTRSDEVLTKAWPIVRHAFRRFESQTAGIAVASSPYLRRHHVIEQHYGVIHEVSMRGESALTESARRELAKVSREREETPEVLGGHQFLRRYPFFTSRALAVYYDSLPSVRLGGGMYGVFTHIEGEPTVILNGFHPEQLNKFWQETGVILLLVLRSRTPWKTIRQELTGVTDPRKAQQGSIRAELLRLKDELQLGPVSALYNGIHVSAGPVEAMVEIGRYMSDFDHNNHITPDETSLGRAIRQIPRGSNILAALSANDTLALGSKIDSAFDLTEEMDSWSLLEAIKSSALRPVSITASAPDR